MSAEAELRTHGRVARRVRSLAAEDEGGAIYHCYELGTIEVLRTYWRGF
jgi:hypothetical protein